MDVIKKNPKLNEKNYKLSFCLMSIGSGRQHVLQPRHAAAIQSLKSGALLAGTAGAGDQPFGLERQTWRRAQ